MNKLDKWNVKYYDLVMLVAGQIHHFLSLFSDIIL